MLEGGTTLNYKIVGLGGISGVILSIACIQLYCYKILHNTVTFIIALFTLILISTTVFLFDT